MATPTMTKPAPQQAPSANAPQQSAPSPAGQGGPGGGITTTITIETRTRPNTEHDQTFNLNSASRVPPGQEYAQAPDQQQKPQQAEKAEPSKEGGMLKMLKAAVKVALDFTPIGMVVNGIKSAMEFFSGAKEVANASSQNKGHAPHTPPVEGARAMLHNPAKGMEKSGLTSPPFNGAEKNSPAMANGASAFAEKGNKAPSSLANLSPEALNTAKNVGQNLAAAGAGQAMQGKAAPATAMAHSAPGQQAQQSR